jgi:copper chaperone CopZ
MKILFKSFLAFTLLFTQILFAQTLNSTFKVKGECGMCKERIETTAKKAVAQTANWNAETQQLTVEFDQAKVTSDAILKQIAEVGYDNERFRAPDVVYDGLPGCCHYERTPSFPKASETEHASSTVSQAPSPKENNQFYVRGNCVSCKNRIEAAAKSAGAGSALWDPETQIVTLDFDESKTSADAILKKIADVGHDNEKYTASNTVYDALPGCCLYDRTLPLGVKSSLVHMEEAPARKDFTQHADHVDKTIEEVKVVRLGEATALNKKETGLTFNISSKELLKAACCNLSESFETNATVDV